MTSVFASFATVIALFAGNGPSRNIVTAAAAPAGSGVVPAIDVPAPWYWDAGHEIRLGGQGVRVEFDDADLTAAMSTWYWLTYIDGGTRLRVFEHYAASTRDLQSDMVESANVAWRLASQAVGSDTGSTEVDPLPRWARIHTNNDTGGSGGLMFTLAYIDLLTTGKLAGNLRIAGTGGVGPDGVVTPAQGIDAKVAAAMLARPDVIFTTSPPTSIEHVTIVESHHTRNPDDGYTVAEWLNVSGYEQAGRNAAHHPATLALVVVHDIRQALAWLCGRTTDATTCAAADRTATIPIGSKAVV